MVKSAAPVETLYSIGQVNAITGIPKTTIRFWEREFSSFLVPLRSAGNQRRYDVKTVATLKMIDQLVNDDGYTLEGARRKLQALESDQAQNDTSASIKNTGEVPASKLDELADTMTNMVLHRLFEKSRQNS
jgi:DNA-binding transcriptional MerR regulator